MKAIIIAAGSGKRISENFANTPKSLIQVNGKSIISKQMSILNSNGVNEIIIITGPFKEKFSFSNVKFIHDETHLQHDILGSLIVAKKELFDDVIIIYSDILFDDLIIKKVINSKNDIGIAIDLNWKKQYENRKLHPLSEAENVLFDNSNKIIEIKKNIQKSNSLIGEFLGIMKLSNEGCKNFLKTYEKISDKNKQFHDANSLNSAYLTDMLQELIESNVEVHPIIIDSNWCEIDTIEDLKNAEDIF